MAGASLSVSCSWSSSCYSCHPVKKSEMPPEVDRITGLTGFENSRHLAEGGLFFVLGLHPVTPVILSRA